MHRDTEILSAISYSARDEEAIGNVYRKQVVTGETRFIFCSYKHYMYVNLSFLLKHLKHPVLLSQNTF